MATKLQEVSAIPVGEKFRRESFAIWNARQQPPVNADRPQMFGLLGECEPGELTAQLPYRFWGRWERSNYGDQFRFDSFAPIQPHTQAGIVKYLQQAKHVGPATAILLWDEFGGDAVRVLRESPEQAAEALGGRRLSPEKAKEASEDLRKLRAAEDLTIQLYGLLDGRGFGKGAVRQAIKLWGADAFRLLTRDPYRSQALRGVGFLKADKFYLELGKDPAKLKRQAYCLAYAVAKESDAQGHVWVQVQGATEYMKAAIAGADVAADRALTLAVRGKILRTCTDEAGRVWVADVRRASAEEHVSRCLVDAMAGESIQWPSIDRKEFGDLTDHQREQLAGALRGPIAILGGRPGTGKTFTLTRLVRAIQTMHGRTCVSVLAPTGKAAQRVKEVMAEAGLEGVAPTTIHSGLGVESCDGGGFEFRHRETNPLPCRFLIVEESSMLGTGLLSSLLRARARGCGILFVGDVNQLPPVEFGAPLRDMIAAGLPYGELREIHRNAGSIVRVCSAIVDRQPWEPDEELAIDAQPPRNLRAIQCRGDRAFAEIAALLESLPFDPVWDCQVIVAVNKRSPAGREALNKQLQDLLNPAKPGAAKSPFREGDKVIQLKNSSLPLADQRGDGTWVASDQKAMVANGEIGRVLAVAEKNTVVLFPTSKEPVIVFRAAGNAKGNDDDDTPESKGENVKADGRPDPKKDEEKTNTGCDLDLAYAVTCHKMQGSQAPVAIVCLDDYPGATGPYGVCDRAWLYTAISRAQKACVLVGARHAADSMCRREFISRRKTMMAEMIRRLAAKAGVLLVQEGEVW